MAASLIALPYFILQREPLWEPIIWSSVLLRSIRSSLGVFLSSDVQLIERLERGGISPAHLPRFAVSESPADSEYRSVDNCGNS